MYVRAFDPQILPSQWPMAGSVLLPQTLAGPLAEGNHGAGDWGHTGALAVPAAAAAVVLDPASLQVARAAQDDKEKRKKGKNE